MFDLSVNMTLYTSTSMNDAMKLPPSYVTRLFESKPFDDFSKREESKLKTQSAIVARLNEVIRAISSLIKTASSRSFYKSF